jgi:fermentation-respiration switch protein FrsA (DUF1100 family)
MKRGFRIALTVLGIILVATLVALAIVTKDQAHDLVTHPVEERSAIDETPASYGLVYEDVIVTTPDGLKLAGWYVPSQNGAAVMAQHGYKSDRTEMLEEAEMLHRHGYGVLVTSVRAHDLSEGELVSFGYREMQDLEAWYQYLLARDDVEPGKIGILGNSMGGSLAIQYTAENGEIKAVVGHSAFSSLDDTVATSIQHFTGLPSFPFAPMIVFWAEQEVGFDSSSINAKNWIAEISSRPVFLIQGGADEIISVTSGELLYEAAGEPKELWYEPDLGHATFDLDRPEEFEARVIAFFDIYVLGQ